jgi:hypothetical protein
MGMHDNYPLVTEGHSIFPRIGPAFQLPSVMIDLDRLAAAERPLSPRNHPEVRLEQ